MKIEYFRYFVTISRLHSISAAAKFYNIPQNTLSTIVKQAEEEFGFHIFLRTPDGVACTPQGEEFVKRAKEIDIGYSQILGLKKQVNGKASVRMIMDPVTCALTAMPLTAVFYQTESRGNLRFHEEETERLISSIGREVSKIALVRLDNRTRPLMDKKCETVNMEQERMTWDELCVVVSDRHPLAQAEAVRQSDLAGYPLVCHQAMEHEVAYVLGEDAEFRPGLCCHDGYLYDAVVKEGKTAIVSHLSAAHGTVWKQSGICILPLQDTQRENRQEVVLAYFPGDMGKLRYQTMSDCIRTYFKQLGGGSAQE